MWVHNRRLRRLIPKSGRNVLHPWAHRYLDLKYTNLLRSQNIRKERQLIVATIRRSGTHYIKYLLANYVKLASGTADGPVSRQEAESMLPNTWNWEQGTPRRYPKSTSYLGLINLDDVGFTHGHYQSPYWDRSRVLHLYRNPLDQAISNFFYNAYDKSEGEGSEGVSGPVEFLGQVLDHYAQQYLSYREAAKAGRTNVLGITYEDLVRYPETCLRIVLRWLGLEPDPSLVVTATQYASRDTLERIEGKSVLPDHTATEPIEKVSPNGSIGQWKEYFEDSDVSKVRERLDRFGINLDEFILEA